MLTYEFLTGVPPFEAGVRSLIGSPEMYRFSHGQDHQETYKRIASIDLRFPSYISREARDFISKVLYHVRFDVASELSQNTRAHEYSFLFALLTSDSLFLKSRITLGSRNTAAPPLGRTLERW